MDIVGTWNGTPILVALCVPLQVPNWENAIFHHSLPKLHYAVLPVLIFLVFDVCQEVIEAFLPGTGNPNAKCVKFEFHHEQTKLFKFASGHFPLHNIQLVCE